MSEPLCCGEAVHEAESTCSQQFPPSNHTDAAAEEQPANPTKASSCLIVLIFCFSVPSNPTELVSISADGEAAKALEEKAEKRSEVEKQNKFSDMMPEAARLCRRTPPLHLPAELKERIFKRRQKQRASLLTGKRAGGNAVSQHVSSV